MTARFIFVLLFPRRGSDAREWARLADQGCVVSSETAFLPHWGPWPPVTLQGIEVEARGCHDFKSQASALEAKGQGPLGVYSQSLVPPIQLNTCLQRALPEPWAWPGTHAISLTLSSL